MPNKNGFILTSSRDESIHRSTLKPQVYQHEHGKLVYPKDGIANGTWIAASQQKRFACLLNGAFGRHKRKKKYSKSRGIVLLDSFGYGSANDFAQNYSLEGVEPFTLLLMNYNDKMVFEEFIWDDVNAHVKQIESAAPYIWLSAYLYSAEEQMQRKEWFKAWLKTHEDPKVSEILGFHLDNHPESVNNPLLVHGEDGLHTLSVSQIIVDNEKLRFHYLELDGNEEIKIDLDW